MILEDMWKSNFEMNDAMYVGLHDFLEEQGISYIQIIIEIEMLWLTMHNCADSNRRQAPVNIFPAYRAVYSSASRSQRKFWPSRIELKTLRKAKFRKL